MELRASNLVGSFKVALMDPGVGAVLDTFNHGLGLVVAAWVLLVGILVKDGGPQDGATLFGGHGGTHSRKVGAAALLHIIEVHVECQNPNTAGTLMLITDVVRLCVW